MRRLPPILRYALTGGTAAVVDLGGFVLLQAAGLGLGLAAGLSFAVAAAVNYALTARFVFAARPGARSFGMFLVFALGGLVINAGVTVLAGTALALPGWLAKCCGIGVAFGFNYAVNARVVFRRRDRREGT